MEALELGFGMGERDGYLQEFSYYHINGYKRAHS
jgi:hypothetical protein